MSLWTRRLCLALLLASWALAVGLHDLVMDDHDHDAHSPETTITQVWGPTLAPVDAPQSPLGVLVILVLILWVIRRPELVLKPCLPESRHSPPRPPTLQNLLYRGPPGRLLPILNP